MRLDKLASPSALGFIAAAVPAALPTSAAGVAAAAIMAAGTAILFVYNAIQDFKKEKYDAELAYIDRLYQEHLAKIAIHECNLTAGFPPIFQKNGDHQYQAMSMTDAQVANIANNGLRAPTDPHLVTYRHHIICAIKQLKKYYFAHTDKTGLTVQVLLYLLTLLEKLLQFEGYAFDIAYLDALSKFICIYASSKGENSTHFTRLDPAFRHIDFATQKLRHHRETRSQAEMLAELRGSCTFYIDQLIRTLTKFLLPNEEWELINAADPYLLREGIYETEYVTRLAGPVAWTHNQKTLPTDCALTNAVKKLTRFYLHTIDATRCPRIPSQHDLCINVLPKDVLENIHAIFEAQPEKHPINTSEILITLTELGKLIHQLTSFLYFLNELTKTIESLGSIEMDNPSHCKRLYALHETLSEHIKMQAGKVQTLFQNLNLRNDHRMRIAEKECFLRESIKLLEEMRVNIDRQSDLILERRKEFYKKNHDNLDSETEREHMAGVIKRVAQACNITLSTLPSISPTPVEATRAIPPAPTQPPIPSAIAANESAITRTPPDLHVTPARADNIATISSTVFPNSYHAMHETAKTKSIHINLQLLYLMLELMSDYTKNDSRASRILHGSFFHHHIDDAAQFTKNLTEKMRSLNDNADPSTTPLVREQLAILFDITQKPDINQMGSFARRVAFITEKCGEKGIALPPHVPAMQRTA